MTGQICARAEGALFAQGLLLLSDRRVSIGVGLRFSVRIPEFRTSVFAFMDNAAGIFPDQYAALISAIRQCLHIRFESKPAGRVNFAHHVTFVKRKY
jgi:hypothetical protein